MLPANQTIEKLFCAVFNERVKQRFEVIIIVLAIAGFLIHLALVMLKQSGVVALPDDPALNNAVAAIYTPFSFILVYEVFLLIYYLPQSFTAAIAKQYEVISLLIARDIFHDISESDRGEGWFQSMDNLYLLVDAGGLLFVFFGIYLFHKLRHFSPKLERTPRIDGFIRVKQVMALLLLPIVIGMLAFSAGEWIFHALSSDSMHIQEFKDIDRVFYDGFFKVLIVIDVLILLLSFPFTTSYAQVMRNTGFVISTVLIRLSFTSAPILDILLVIGAITFAYLTLVIYNRIEPLSEPEGALTEMCGDEDESRRRDPSGDNAETADPRRPAST